MLKVESLEIDSDVSENDLDAAFTLIFKLPSGMRLYDRFGDFIYVEYGFCGDIKKDWELEPTEWRNHLITEMYVEETKTEIGIYHHNRKLDKWQVKVKREVKREITLFFWFRVYLGNEDESSLKVLEENSKEYWGSIFKEMKLTKIIVPLKMQKEIIEEFDKFKQKYHEINKKLIIQESTV